MDQLGQLILDKLFIKFGTCKGLRKIDHYLNSQKIDRKCSSSDIFYVAQYIEPFIE